VNANQVHLGGRLALVDLRVRRLVNRKGGGGPVDPLSSLVITRAQVEQLLSETASPDGEIREPDLQAETERLDAEAMAADQGDDVRLIDLALRFELSPLDLDLLCIALAPDLDGRFGRLFAYLQDDFGARRATVSLALELLDRSPLDVVVRSRLQPGSPLTDGGLLSLREDDAPLLQRRLVVRDRVVMHVLGDDTLDPAVGRLVIQPVSDLVEGADALGDAIASRSPVVYLREAADGLGVAHALAALYGLGVRALAVDLATGIARGDAHILDAAILDARLLGAGLVVPHCDQLAAVSGAVDTLCRSVRALVLVGTAPWDPTWSESVPLCLDLPSPSLDARSALWSQALRDAEAKGADDEFAAFEGLAGFDLSPAQVVRTAEHAAQRASYAGRDLTEDDLREAARHQNGSAILSLARRVEPSAVWDDLIVTEDVEQQLRELLNRVKLAPQVLDRWDLRTSTRRGGGTRALFCGPPGTGKTLAAEVISGQLGLDLFVVDLSSVVDKYIGETEKHLERMFQAASEANGVLFFDEADALFGKRSEVREAKDRYANIETAYLLQRLDVFAGFVVLATNLRSNLDEAFTRRIDVVVEMLMPDVCERRALWERCLGARMPRHEDVDLDFLAGSFELAGGSIRNIALTSAFFAADGGGCLRMEDLIRGVHREYRKMGRLITESEFGPWWDLARS
jgi:AAA+ superfamily predicted ATPase